MEKERVVLFASGSPTGGRLAERIVRYAMARHVSYEVVAVIFSNPNAGVQRRIREIPRDLFDTVPVLECMPGPYTAEAYKDICARHRATRVVLAGWMRFVVGLDPRYTVGSHPARTSNRRWRLGGPGMYGRRVHEEVHRRVKNGGLREWTTTFGGEKKVPFSGFTIFFVVDGDGDPKKAYDKGPIIWEGRVRLDRRMTVDQIEDAVKGTERVWMPMILDMVFSGKIRLEDGKVVCPPGYMPMQR